MNSGQKGSRSQGEIGVVSAGESSGVSRGRWGRASAGVWAVGLAENGAGRDLQREDENRKREMSGGKGKEARDRAGSLPARFVIFPNCKITKMPLEFSDL